MARDVWLGRKVSIIHYYVASVIIYMHNFFV